MQTAAATCHQVVDRDEAHAYSPAVPPSKKATRDSEVRFRATDAEKDAFERAGARLGLSMSAWLRLVARKAAEELLGEPIADIAPAKK